MPDNIAIIIDNISLNAGTERAVTSLANGLERQFPGAYKIYIISLFTRQTDTSFFVLHPAIELIHLNHPNNFSFFTKFFWYRTLIKKLKKTINATAFDVMIGSTYIHNILLPVLTKNTGIKTIGCEHEVYGYPSKIIQKIRRKSYPKLNAVVVLNQTEYHHYSFLQNVFVIPNSLPFEAESVSALDSKNIIAAGRLTYQKGFDLLISSMDIVVQKHPDWHLTIFGEGEDAAALRQQIEDKKLENHIKLGGLVKNISEQYAKSSIFALTSRWESFGLVIIEAMSHGLPVVAFDADGPKNLIRDNENGFLISNWDTKAFADKLLLLIEDDVKRNQVSSKAFATAQQYREQNIIPQWKQLIQQLLNR